MGGTVLYRCVCVCVCVAIYTHVLVGVQIL